jgi:hypothetical protein
MGSGLLQRIRTRKELRQGCNANLAHNNCRQRRYGLSKCFIEALAEQGDLRSLLPLLRESRKARLPKHFFDKALQRFTETLKS